MPRALAVPVALAALLAVPAVGHADRRAFPHAYEYGTTAEGQTEIELHSAQTRSPSAAGPYDEFHFALELEHGLTDRWDVSLYHRFMQNNRGAALGLASIELESRYRLAERGEWPVDVALIGKIDREFGRSVHVGHLTAVLARDFGALTVTANLQGQVSLLDFDYNVFSVRYAAGVTYEVTPTWNVGAESWGAVRVDPDDYQESWVGPAASWAPGRRTWITASVGIGLTERSEDYVVSGLIGLSL